MKPVQFDSCEFDELFKVVPDKYDKKAILSVWKRVGPLNYHILKLRTK